MTEKFTGVGLCYCKTCDYHWVEEHENDETWYARACDSCHAVDTVAVPVDGPSGKTPGQYRTIWVRRGILLVANERPL